ncbi:hypothetical protein [Sanguibacter keddieii]|uniref:hypothetical protein n=1 Tax=Sanguibacter keddieii TaxID=60920 RepID=UPI000325D32F|nr:hypothetical protein [Sanguibacter keddieii]
MGDSRTLLEQSARLWLRAYPRRWRFSCGEDLVGTLLDLAGPDARTVRLRDGLSVLWAGWALRFREHPPLLPWLRYRLFGADLPVDYRVWMIDDLLGRLHALRWFVAYLVLLVVSMGMFFGVVGDLDVWTQMLSGWPWWVAFGVLSTVVGPRYSARKVWRKHVSGWVPPELRPRRQRAEAVRELAEFRAASGYEGPSSPLARG